MWKDFDERLELSMQNVKWTKCSKWMQLKSKVCIHLWKNSQVTSWRNYNNQNVELNFFCCNENLCAFLSEAWFENFENFIKLKKIKNYFKKFLKSLLTLDWIAQGGNNIMLNGFDGKFEGNVDKSHLIENVEKIPSWLKIDWNFTSKLFHIMSFSPWYKIRTNSYLFSKFKSFNTISVNKATLKNSILFEAKVLFCRCSEMKSCKVF